ncbi:MAG TPA: formyl transferase [Holophagaceae bacterium]|nr:formyl transferase [Holophagaceae bacterium]
MPNIVALTNGSPHSWIILNALAERFGSFKVLIEDKESRRVLLRRRMKRQGFLKVAGQVGFTLLQVVVGRLSRPRIRRIIQEFALNPHPAPGCEVIRIGSVNAPACRDALAAARPDVVVVFGTRMIRAETLSVIQVPILNLHSGITPKYRGQAGGYWALASGDPEHAGVTVHLLDAGVDTGAVLRQAPFSAGAGDTFPTYFYLQAAALREPTVQAVEDVLAGTHRPYRPELPSRQHYHPTLWGYLYRGIRRGVW